MTMGYFNNPSANKDLYTADNFLKTGNVMMFQYRTQGVDGFSL